MTLDQEKLFAELAVHAAEAEDHRVLAAQAEFCTWSIVDRLRAAGVPWRPILFCLGRARGRTPSEARELAQSARKRLHDFRTALLPKKTVSFGPSTIRRRVVTEEIE
ncbi:MAG: hypothetical protein QM778_00715 [Myxococcales bacterium]